MCVFVLTPVEVYLSVVTQAKTEGATYSTVAGPFIQYVGSSNEHTSHHNAEKLSISLLGNLWTYIHSSTLTISSLPE